MRKNKYSLTNKEKEWLKTEFFLSINAKIVNFDFPLCAVIVRKEGILIPCILTIMTLLCSSLA